MQSREEPKPEIDRSKISGEVEGAALCACLIEAGCGRIDRPKRSSEPDTTRGAFIASVLSKANL